MTKPENSSIIKSKKVKVNIKAKTMEYKDYYKILGVEKNATTDEIKKAYRALVKKYHPDSGNSKERSKEKFQEISEAYEVLKDEEKRKKYDEFGQSGNFSSGSHFDPSQYGYTGGFGGSGSKFSDFFDMIFGGNGIHFGSRTGRAGGNPFSGFGGFGGNTAYEAPLSQAEINISVYEAYHGTEKMMTLQGNGQSKPINVKIPAGIKSGEKIRMKNAGVEFKIKIEDDAIYRIADGNLIQKVKIAPFDAVLGGKVKFTTIDGSDISLNIKPGTQSGKKLKIPQKGFKDRKGVTGDLFVEIVITVPEYPSEKETELYRELQKLHYEQ